MQCTCTWCMCMLRCWDVNHQWMISSFCFRALYQPQKNHTSYAVQRSALFVIIRGSWDLLSSTKSFVVLNANRNVNHHSVFLLCAYWGQSCSSLLTMVSDHSKLDWKFLVSKRGLGKTWFHYGLFKEPSLVSRSVFWFCLFTKDTHIYRSFNMMHVAYSMQLVFWRTFPFFVWSVFFVFFEI